ncbi:hypothetical protein BOTBODRAFT_93512, partial [Botryobasidium botryosum FD-172 SS1]
IRVLVIGRVNSGKITVLHAVMNGRDPSTLGELVHSDESDELIHESHSSSRPIKNQLVSTNWPNFIFHESSGFAYGSNHELQEIAQFIRKCESEVSEEKELHAIWY